MLNKEEIEFLIVQMNSEIDRIDELLSLDDEQFTAEDDMSLRADRARCVAIRAKMSEQ